MVLVPAIWVSNCKLCVIKLLLSLTNIHTFCFFAFFLFSVVRLIQFFKRWGVR
uniref:Uncharacterized protein n=1 Tax=Heterorhabditis bacteriophora TaxID=37862 RepID=A0A1I7WSL9_HETBA